MIPAEPDELNVLAGEYVLGLLDDAAAREIDAALGENAALREAVAFWQEQLHPLAALAPAAEPPPELWDKIARRIESAPRQRRLWQSLALWRGATAAAAAIAASLALYIAATPPPAAPSYVAVLYAPQQQQAAFVATGGRNGLLVHAVARETAPRDRGFELWVIPAGAKPISLGLMSDEGRLEIASLPTPVSEGLTLAITIEPKEGAPHAAPSSAPVFLGTLLAAR
jgi:anti-sigma-K factor RskA